MRVIYTDFPIYNTNGSLAGKLDGTYEATPNTGQQVGWYALQKVLEDGSLDDEIVANVHIIGTATVA